MLLISASAGVFVKAFIPVHGSSPTNVQTSAQRNTESLLWLYISSSVHPNPSGFARGLGGVRENIVCII